MQSKIFPFNKNLLKKDWKITKWFFYGFLVLLILAIPYYIGQVIAVFNNPVPTENIMNEFFRIRGAFKIQNGFVIFAVGTIPVFLSVLLIGEEKRKKTIEIMISGPYSRYEVFFNKIAIGIFILVMPIIIAGTILMGMTLINPVLSGLYSISHIFLWIFAYSSVIISVFAFASLIGVIFGSSIGQFVCTYIFIFFPVMFHSLLVESYDTIYTLINGNRDMNYTSWIHNMSQTAQNITPMIHFYRAIELSSYTQLIYSAGLLLMSLAIFAFSLMLFDISKMEKNSEVLTFEGLEGFFRLGVLICSMLLGGAVFKQIVNIGSSGIFVGYIIGAFAGYRIPLYLIQKNRAS